MASTTDKLDCDATVGRAKISHGLGCELYGLAEELRVLADAWQERPGELDRCLLSTSGDAPGVEAMIVEIYRFTKNRLYAEDSALCTDPDAWEALNDQKDEFLEFYKTAISALETYKAVLPAYKLINDGTSRPRRGDLERIRQDTRTLITERDLCIEAVSNFQGKLSGMLTIL